MTCMSKAGPAWIALALAVAVSACGMPQATEPTAAVPAVQEPMELLGGPDGEQSRLAEAPSELSAPARRPGWGTMAPIPNPGEDGPGLRASGETSYRVIGPASPEPLRAQAPSHAGRRAAPVRSGSRVRARVESGPTGWIQVEAPPIARTTPGKARVRHWITPVAQR